MHRRQQQAVAEMMGVDVDVARKMFDTLAVVLRKRLERRW